MSKFHATAIWPKTYKKYLSVKLIHVKYKDTCFCPQKTIRLASNLQIRTPRKPNSAKRKIFWAEFANPFYSKDFVYLPGEGIKTESGKANQNLSKHKKVLARNGLTKDLRGLKYKIMHGARTKKFSFGGLEYRKHARSKYGAKYGGVRWNSEKLAERGLKNKTIKKKNPRFFQQDRLPTNRFYD